MKRSKQLYENKSKLRKYQYKVILAKFIKNILFIFKKDDFSFVRLVLYKYFRQLALTIIFRRGLYSCIAVKNATASRISTRVRALNYIQKPRHYTVKPHLQQIHGYQLQDKRLYSYISFSP